MAMRKTFTCELLGTGPNKAFPYVELPFDSVAFFGTRARVPVKVTLRGVTLAMSLAPMGGRHVLGFRGELAREAGVAVGDRVRITLEKDDAPRTVAAPRELAAALAKDAVAKAAWDALAPSHRREHAEAIAAAKRPDTRARRIEKSIAMLHASGGRPAKPMPSTKPLATRLRLTDRRKVAVLGSPRGFRLEVPTTSRVAAADAALLFVEDRAALAGALRHVKALAPEAVLWFAYPKTTSGVRTDLTRDLGWDALERLGYAAVTQVAVDETWSALRFRKQ